MTTASTSTYTIDISLKSQLVVRMLLLSGNMHVIKYNHYITANQGLLTTMHLALN